MSRVPYKSGVTNGGIGNAGVIVKDGKPVSGRGACRRREADSGTTASGPHGCTCARSRLIYNAAAFGPRLLLANASDVSSYPNSIHIVIGLGYRCLKGNLDVVIFIVHDSSCGDHWMTPMVAVFVCDTRNFTCFPDCAIFTNNLC